MCTGKQKACSHAGTVKNKSLPQKVVVALTLPFTKRHSPNPEGQKFHELNGGTGAMFQVTELFMYVLYVAEGPQLNN